MFAKFYIPCFLILFFVSHVFAQKTIIITDSIETINVCEYASVFQDKDGNIPFEQVKKQHFQPNEGSSFRFSFSPKVFWFRFQVNNQGKFHLNHWYFLWNERRNDYVDVYIPQPSGKYRILQGGMLAKASQKAYNDLVPTYKLGVLPANGLQTYYVRVKSNWPINSQFTLVSQNELIDLLPIIYMNIWIVVGIHLLRVLYNIILAWYIRNIPFRWYTFHTFVVLIANLGSYGIIGLFFSNSPILGGYLNDIFFQLMPASFTLFFYSILKVKLNYSHLKVVFFFIVACSIIQIPLFLIVPKIYLLMLHNYLLAFTVVFLIGISIYTLIKRIPINAYLLIPSFFMLPPFFFLSIQMLGYIKGDWLYLLMYPTTLLEILSLALVIGKVIEISNREKNLTEQKLFAEKIETEKLQELNTLKTQFFTNISHEFRTPLTLLVGPIDDLQQKYPKEGMIVVMQRNLQRLQTLINQLLDISKLEAGEMTIHLQETDFSEFLNHLFASFESLAQSKKIIFNHSQSHLHQLGAFDLDKLEKIVTNLLSNAFKFTPENGRINVRVEYADKHIFMTVQDYGIGIAPERLPHIFDRFYQIDDSNQRQHEGTGIGLSLVKELVEVLNGKIDVSSELGKGTLFSLSLPFTNIEKPSMPLGQFVRKMALETAFVPTEERKTINTENPILLIVEDNPDLRRYVGSIFENQYQLLMAVDGEEGLAKAIEFIPDMVVCDLMMPKLDGLGFCEQLKNDERINHIPVIMLTAKASLADKLIGLQHGADDYLSKPFNKEELTLRVKNLVGQRQLMREKYAFQTVGILPAIEVVKEPTMNDLFIQKAKVIIDKHLDKSEFDVEAFANEMNLSSVQLRRKLKAITDQTVTEFVRNYRLEIASEMLKKKMGTVSEIAYKVGFESMPYFSKVFQEKYGKMASEWK